MHQRAVRTLFDHTLNHGKEAPVSVIFISRAPLPPLKFTSTSQFSSVFLVDGSLAHA